MSFGDFLEEAFGGGKAADSSQEGAQNQSSTFKCASCGKPLSGQPALYCDGCAQYYCYSCGIASGDMKWNCPNGAIEAQRVNL